MSGATRPDIPAAKVCEHFYASHCYRGMSIRLCMLCHEPDWDDLAGQLAERLAANAAKERPFGLLPWEGRTEEQRELDMRIGEAVAAAERERLGVILLSEALTDEEVAGIRERFEAAMANAGPLRVLPSDRWRERAEAAEARLVALSFHFPAFRRALAVATGEAEYECEAADYRAALEALGGGTEPS